MTGAPFRICLITLVLPMLLVACAGRRPGRELVRRGDEIVVCGRYYHTGSPVVLWTDPGGYDAYRVEQRFAAPDRSAWEPSGGADGPPTPNRYDLRSPQGDLSGSGVLAPDDLERVRGGGWDLDTLRRVVDQFVIHYDAAGTSRQCFKVLHDMRGLSIHFMIDLDGTIYQTLDVKERAWHATTSNHRSVGVEMANIGAYAEPITTRDVLAEWYTQDQGGVRVTLPAWMGDGGIRTPGFVGRPARSDLIIADIQGQTLRQRDFTTEQYESLTRLTATLCRVLPEIRADYPRDAGGRLITGKLPDEQLATYAGLLGHYHIQSNKVDPGPALDWERVIRETRRLMR